MKFSTVLFVFLQIFYSISAANVSQIDNPVNIVIGVSHASPAVQYITQDFSLNNGLQWLSNSKALVFVDKVYDTFNMYYPNNGKTYTLKITELEGYKLISATPVHNSDDKYVITTQNSMHLLTTKGNREKMTYKIEYISDILSDSNKAITTTKVDRKMNMIFGTKLIIHRFEGNTELYHINMETNETKILDNELNATSGLCFNYFHTKLYVSDNIMNVIYEYDYDANKAEVSNKKLIFDVEDYECSVTGRISSLASDIKNMLYIGFQSSNKIIAYDLKKQEIHTSIPLPTWHTTSLSFGGLKSEILYVGTKKDNDDTEKDCYSGKIYAVSGTGSFGIREHPLKI